MLDWPFQYALAAVEELHEASVEKYRISAYPVFLQHSKKGTTWSKFLDELGLGTRSTGGRTKKSRKLDKEKLAKVYDIAARIRARDLGR